MCHWNTGTAVKLKQLLYTASYKHSFRVVSVWVLSVKVRACFFPVSFCTSFFKWMLTISFPSISLSHPFHQKKFLFWAAFRFILIKIERAWVCLMAENTMYIWCSMRLFKLTEIRFKMGKVQREKRAHASWKWNWKEGATKSVPW